MSTDVATTGTSALAISAGQDFWNDKQLAALRQLGLAEASNGDLAVFWHQCVRTGLDPFARQIYMVGYQGKQTIQTGIDGFRLIARRAVDTRGETLGYEDTLWCGTDGHWVDVWLAGTAPAAAKVTVIRNGQRYPAVALHSEYVATTRDGQPNRMWASKPALMLAKCAEALALRKAFPQDLSGLYTSDEMGQAGGRDQVTAAVDAPSVAEPTSEATGDGPLEAALAGVAVATTEEQILAVWNAHAARLDTKGKATLKQACRDAKERLSASVDDDGVVDAEIVADTEPEERKNASRGQLQALSIKFEALGLPSKAEHRPDVLAVCSFVAGRAVSTRNELTATEAKDIDQALKECLNAPDRAAAFASLLEMAKSEGAAA